MLETSIVSGVPGFAHTIITQHFLNVKVSNHDKISVFLTQPRITLKNRIEHIPIFHDDLYGKKIKEIGRLEPGNSINIYSNPNKYIDQINELDNVIIYDKIGRAFKGNL